MTIVYAQEPYTYVYGGHNETHKQGKAYPGRALNVIGSWGDDWLEISPLELDRDIDPDYTAYWVNQGEVLETNPSPVPDPDPLPLENVTDLEAGIYFVGLMKWVRKLWR